MTIWIYTRHYINIVIIYATMTTFRTLGPFILDWDAQQYKCWISQYVTLGLLTSLQAINLFWLYCVLKIAFNIVFKSTVEDVRSDDDDTADEGERKEGVQEARRNAKEEQRKENEKLLEPQMNGSAVHAVNGSAKTKKKEKHADALKEEKKRR